MTQPTFSDGPPVPLMVEGTLDAAGLRQLFADLTAAATVVGVRQKGGPAEYTAADDLSADTARDRLLAGAIRAVQIRYRYDGHEWTDTVFATAPGFRVIRCQHS